jgi:hypothetical protein
LFVCIFAMVLYFKIFFPFPKPKSHPQTNWIKPSGGGIHFTVFFKGPKWFQSAAKFETSV